MTSPHDNLITGKTIEQFNAERFQFANSGFASATKGDHEAARALSLRMLESAIRLHAAPFDVTTQHSPHARRAVDFSIW